jgi:hypothetical protein
MRTVGCGAAPSLANLDSGKLRSLAVLVAGLISILGILALVATIFVNNPVLAKGLLWSEPGIVDRDALRLIVDI